MSEEVIDYGIKRYKIDKLKLPGDWKKILKSRQAREQAGSIHRVGLIHHPTVRKSDKLLICGQYRTAGLVVLEETHVEAKVIECSDEHVTAMRLEENSERRHDPAEQRAARARRLDQIVQEVEAEEPQLDNRGRKRAAMTVALERQAEELGITKHSLHQATWREKKREARDQLERESMATDPVDDRGMEMDEAFAMQLSLVRRRVADAHNKLVSAAASLKAIKSQGLPFSHVIVDELRERTNTLAEDVATHKPISLCYFCRALAGVVEQCNDCHCTGWLSQHDIDNTGDIPPGLRNDEEPAVMHQGSIVLVDDYMKTHDLEPDVDLDELWA